MSFPLVPKSETLNDLERRNDPHFALFLPNLVVSVAHCVKVIHKAITMSSSRYRGGTTGRALDLRSTSCGFNSCSRQSYVTTLGKLCTPMCLCHQAVTWYRPRGGDALRLGR